MRNTVNMYNKLQRQWNMQTEQVTKSNTATCRTAVLCQGIQTASHQCLSRASAGIEASLLKACLTNHTATIYFRLALRTGMYVAFAQSDSALSVLIHLQPASGSAHKGIPFKRQEARLEATLWALNFSLSCPSVFFSFQIQYHKNIYQ